MPRVRLPKEMADKHAAYHVGYKHSDGTGGTIEFIDGEANVHDGILKQWKEAGIGQDFKAVGKEKDALEVGDNDPGNPYDTEETAANPPSGQQPALNPTPVPVEEMTKTEKIREGIPVDSKDFGETSMFKGVTPSGTPGVNKDSEHTSKAAEAKERAAEHKPATHHTTPKK